MRLLRSVLLALPLALACGRDTSAASPPITAFVAASLARAVTALADSFTQRTGVPVLRELGGSLDHARKLTDLGRVPDVLMLADDEVIAALMPTHLDWYIRFATNRMTIAYRPGSRGADSITADNWWRVLARPGVTIGRADPAIAPAGRHALALLKRAETYYDAPGLSARVLRRASLRFVRGNATELAALLESGEVDYIIDYASLAEQHGFRTVTLPAELTGAVLYGLSVPRAAPHRQEAIAFVNYVLSDEGKQVLRDAHVDALRVPVAVGTRVPPEFGDKVRTLADLAGSADGR